MASLTEVLLEARRRGFVGPGPIEPHLDHAARFAAAVGDEPTRGLDLGSGGGLPGLALAQRWPASSWVLLDANARRADFLGWAVGQLQFDDRVLVDHRRAEQAARDPERRGVMDLVVARSFGGPAVVAECGSPFLAVGGRLVVSEPPDPAGRWPAAGLASLGLVADPPADRAFARFRQVRPCPERYPRRDGVPAKRPLF